MKNNQMKFRIQLSLDFHTFMVFLLISRRCDFNESEYITDDLSVRYHSF